MKKLYNISTIASAALLFVAASIPLHPAVSDTLGDTLGGLGGTLGGATGEVNSPSSEYGSASVNPNGESGADANSPLANGIIGRARYLGDDELANLCLAAGGGESGCGSGNRAQTLGVLSANLNELNSAQLAGLCASVGGGCDASAAVPGGVANGAIPGLTKAEVVAYKKRCVNILSSPQNYDDDIVGICRLIKRQKI
jgi:hypothetical protein